MSLQSTILWNFCVDHSVELIVSFIVVCCASRCVNKVPAAATTRVRQAIERNPKVLAECQRVRQAIERDIQVLAGATERRDNTYAVVNGLGGVIDFLARAVKGLVPVDQWCVVLDPSRNYVYHGTALMLACQWQQWSAHLGAEFSNADVRFLLAAGADVNLRRPDNGCTSLFFAVKYGDIETVDLLLTAGADATTRDVVSGRTAMCNAVERSNVAVVRRLLEAGCCATDVAETQTPDGVVSCHNAAELMIMSTTWASWKILGPPSVNDWATTFRLLLQEGACLGDDVLLLVGAYLRASKDRGRYSNLPGSARQIEMNIATSKAAIGMGPLMKTAPKKKIKKKKKTAPEENERAECPICLGSIRKLVQLPCGHDFCRDCIIRHGETTQGQGCPLCRCTLPPELVELVDNPALESSKSFKLTSWNGDISGVRTMFGGPQQRGPAAMTEKQLHCECTALGLVDNAACSTSTESSLRDILRKYEALPVNQCTAGSFKRDGKDGIEHAVMRMHMEAGSTVPIYDGSVLLAKPEHGPVCIRAEVKGTQLYTFISTASTLTVINKALADQLGLRCSDHVSRRFLHGKALKAQLVYDLVVTVSGVTVKINTAIAAKDFDRGLQLGIDFFAQAVHSTIDVMDGCNLVRVQPYKGSDHLRFARESMATRHHEQLRFYQDGGAFISVPLQHISDHDAYHATVSLDFDGTCHCCNWCARPFHNMQMCGPCKTAGIEHAYCGKKCQEAAWVLHKRTIRHRSEKGTRKAESES
jgi:predicted aspartyl protease